MEAYSGNGERLQLESAEDNNKERNRVEKLQLWGKKEGYEKNGGGL